MYGVRGNADHVYGVKKIQPGAGLSAVTVNTESRRAVCADLIDHRARRILVDDMDDPVVGEPIEREAVRPFHRHDDTIDEETSAARSLLGHRDRLLDAQ